MQNFSASEPMIDVVAMNAMGNLLKNPAFVDGTAGWAIPAGATAPLVPGNKAVAGARILRLTWDSDMDGVFYVTQTLSGNFTDRRSEERVSGKRVSVLVKFGGRSINK